MRGIVRGPCPYTLGRRRHRTSLVAVLLFGTAIATVVPAYRKPLYPLGRELRQQATLDCVKHGLGAVGSTQL